MCDVSKKYIVLVRKNQVLAMTKYNVSKKITKRYL